MVDERTCSKGRLAAALALAALLGLPAAAAAAGTPIDETVRASANGTVVVENVSGSVSVKGWKENRVQVRGTLGEGSERLDVKTDDDEVRIEVVLPEGRNRKIEATDLEIRVPKGSDLEIETVSANVAVDDVEGELTVETVSGSIAVRAKAKEAELSSVSGAIEVRGEIPDVSAESVSGVIVVENTRGAVEASTTSGDIRIAGGKFRKVRCESVSGAIRFTGDPDRDADFEIENFSGAVELRLPSGLDAELDLETFSGKIDTDFGGQVRRERFGPGASMNLVLGRGDTSITITTFSGSIDVRKR